MSRAAREWAVTSAKERAIPPRVRLTLNALADCHNEKTSLCCPSVRTLSEMTGWSPRTVRDHLAWLESHDCLRREARYRRDGSQTSTIFLLPITSPVAESSSSPQGGMRVTAGLEQEEEPKDLYIPSGYRDQEVASTPKISKNSKETSTVAVGEGDWDNLWGSGQQREQAKKRQEQLDEKRAAKLSRIRQRAEQLATKPRVDWGPGDLAEHFKSTALSRGDDVMPKLPYPPEIRGQFAELLLKGHRPEHLAQAVEVFLADDRRYSSALLSGQPIWRVFVRAAPDLAAQAAHEPPASSEPRSEWGF